MIEGGHAVKAPLTFQQEALWKSAERHSTGIFAVHLAGRLDKEALTRSLEALVGRHDALRTKIVVVDNVPAQWLYERAQHPLSVIEIVDGPTAARRLCAKQHIERFLHASIYEETGIPFNARLLTLSEDEHVLAITIGHMICDAYSLRILFTNLWRCYGALVQGQPLPFTEPSPRYVDYAIEQRGTNAGWTKEDASYWKTTLRDLTVPRLPIADERARRYGGTMTVLLDFGSTLRREICDLARRTGVLSPAIVMFGIFAAVLAGWCRRREFLLPFAVLGRDLIKHRETCGFFAYHLHIPIAANPEEDAARFLTRTASSVYSAMRHQDFGRISASRADLISGASFNWVSGRPEELAGLPSAAVLGEIGPALEMSVFAPPRFKTAAHSHPPVSLSLLLYDHGDTLSAVLHHDARVTDVEQFAEHLRAATRQVVTAPSTRLCQVQSADPAFRPQG